MGETVKSQPLAISGAGLSGSLLAAYMAQQGYQVEVYEKRGDMRSAEYSGGLSINLALSPRGIRALEEVGVLDDIMEIAIPMKGRMIHAVNGDLTFQPYGKDEHEVINSVSRSELNKKLMDKAEQDGAKIYFNSPTTGFDLQTGHLEVTSGEMKKVVTHTPVLACDGAGSPVRYAIQITPRFNYSQHFLPHGYKELTIPPTRDGGFALEKNALHIWPRGSFMLIALPNPDATFTVTLFLEYEGPVSFEVLKSDDDILAFFQTYFPDTIELMPNLIEEFKQNPVGLLGTIRCYPYHFEDKAVMLGDASHAIVPFYGQGMNAAFEDCRVFNGLVEQHKGDWKQIFPEFTRLRKENCDAIADLALDNFIEMRDRVADDKFLLMKAAELKLYETYPEQIISKYSMVTFSHIPYAIAKRKGEILWDVIRKYTEGITSVDEFDIEAARNEVLRIYNEVDGS